MGALNWLLRIRTVRHDWVFYLVAFLPYFIIGFAVWICLDEAIFAQRYQLTIQWSLLPWVQFPPPFWHLFGVVLYIFGVVGLLFALLLRRTSAPEAGEEPPLKMEEVVWARLVRPVRRFREWLRESPVLVLLGLVGMFFLSMGLTAMLLAFAHQLHWSAISGATIPCFVNVGGLLIEALYLHQLGDLFVAIGLVVMFLVIIRERAED